MSSDSWRVRLAVLLLRRTGYYVVPAEVGEAAFRMLQAEAIGELLAEQARIELDPRGWSRERETRH